MGGVKFDPTVNLGHLLSAGTVLVALAFGWASLDGRQTRLEERTIRLEAARDRDDRETAMAAGLMGRVAAQVEAIQRTVGRIEGVLDRQAGNAGTR